jgi:hypothetical protein
MENPSEFEMAVARAKFNPGHGFMWIKNDALFDAWGK